MWSGRVESWPNIAKAIYAPYVPYVAKYSTLEEQHLSQLLTSVKVCNFHLQLSACKIQPISYMVFNMPHPARFTVSLHLTTELLLLQTSKEDLMDSVQGLGQSITSVSSIAGESLKRCLQFTEGTGFCGLVKSLQVI